MFFGGDGAALPPEAAMHAEAVATPKIFLAAAFGGRRHIKTQYFELPPKCGFLGGNLRKYGTCTFFGGDGAALPPKAAMHVEVVFITKIF